MSTADERHDELRRQVLAAVAAGAALAPTPFRPWAAIARADAASDAGLATIDKIRREINDYLVRGTFVGLAVAVVSEGRTVWEEGFGWADVAARLPATPTTAFCLASLGKPFTATALSVLAQRGALSLDDDASRYLKPDIWPGLHTKHMGVLATIRQLGAHCAGLPSYFQMFPAGSPVPDARTVLTRYGEPAYPALAVYEYSNLGYLALGEIVAHVTGRSFKEFLTTEVLGPLALERAMFGVLSHHSARAALRYDEHGEPIVPYVTATPPSGELYASARDVARFSLLYHDRARRESPSILTEATVRDQTAPIFVGDNGIASTFGWFVGTSASGDAVLVKDGGQPGANTILYIVPSKRYSCVVLSNKSDSAEAVQMIADRITAAILPHWTTVGTAIGFRQAPFAPSEHFAGHWRGFLKSGETQQLAMSIVFAKKVSLFIEGLGWQEVKDAAVFGSRIFTGNATGALPGLPLSSAGATKLRVKLLRTGKSLCGRLLAEQDQPGVLAILPFVVTLERERPAPKGTSS